MNNRLQNLLLFAVVGALACAEPPAAVDDPPQAQPAARGQWVRATSPDSLALLEAPARVVTEEPSIGEVTVLFAARIEAVHVAAGDEVKVGQPMLDVVMPQLNRAAATLIGIDAELEMVEVRLERLTRLEAEKLVRGEELFELRSTRGRLVAERAQALAVLRSCGASPKRAGSILKKGRFTLRAPIDGIVTQIEARVGRYAAEGVALAEVMSSKFVRVEATLMCAPLPPNSVLDLVLTDGSVHRLRNKPIGQVVDPSSGQTRAWFALETPTSIFAGLQGRLRARAESGLVQIPSAAIVHRESDVVVFVVHEDKPVATPVRVASDSGTSALVAGAIEVGAMVVVDPIAVEPNP